MTIIPYFSGHHCLPETAIVPMVPLVFILKNMINAARYLWFRFYNDKQLQIMEDILKRENQMTVISHFSGHHCVSNTAFGPPGFYIKEYD